MSANRLNILGCRANHPLNYLKAIGLLKTISLQLDPSVKGFYDHDSFILETSLSKEQIASFFVHNYIPSPILSPFLRLRNNVFLEKLSQAENPRLSLFRQAYEYLKMAPPKKRQPFPSEKWLQDIASELKYLHPASVGSYKALTLAAYRLCDPLKESSPSPFLVNYQDQFKELWLEENYLGALSQLMSFKTDTPKKESLDYLLTAIFTENNFKESFFKLADFCALFLDRVTYPSRQNIKANPWDYILAINGFVAICAPCTLDTEGRVPFCLSATSYGWENIAANPLRKLAMREMWLPLWNRPLTNNELVKLLSKLFETMVQSKVSSALDLVAEATIWGINPVLAHFLRLGLLFDINTAPLPEVINLKQVALTKMPEAELLSSTKAWLAKWDFLLSSGPKSQKQKEMIKAAEEALFSYLTNQDSSLTKTLINLGQAEIGSSLLPKNTRPDPLTLPTFYLKYAKENSPEYRLALAVASLDSHLPVRSQLEPVSSLSGKWFWNDSVLAQGGNLTEKLAYLLEMRVKFATEKRLPYVPISAAYPAQIKDVELYLEGEIDEDYLESLLNGLILVNYPYPKVQPLENTPDSNLLWHYLLVREAFLSKAKHISHYQNLQQLIIRLRFASLNESLVLAKNLAESSDYPLEPILQPSVNLSRRLLAAALFHAI